MDARDKWFPIDGSGKVVGRFIDTSLDVTQKDGHTVKTFVRPALESKVAGSNESVPQLMKPFNEKELIARCPEGWKHYQAVKAAEAETAAQPQSGIKTVADTPIKGVPIEDLGLFSHDKIVWFKAQGIYTVEQVADLSDTICQNLGFGAKAWRKKANDHLKVHGRKAA